MRPYANFLLINGSMAIGFLLFYSLGWAFKSMVVMLFTLLFACLCFLLEVLLGVVAVARRQWPLVILYSLAGVALFFADRWLLEQAE